MKKLIFILILAALSVAGMAQGTRYAAIAPGYTQPSQPLRFTANVDSVHVVTSDSLTFTITNPQKWLQYQTFTTVLAAYSGSPSVNVTAYGKVASNGSWQNIGSINTWTSGSTPIVITATTPNNYNFLKVSFVASGATQKVTVKSLDIKTANAFDIGSASAYVLGITGGTMAIKSSDWTIGTTGNMANIGTIHADGLITATAGATVTGAAINLNATSNFAVNIGTGGTTAAVTIGGGSNHVAVNSDVWGITTAGVVSGLTGLTSTGAITATGGIVTPTASPVIWAKGGSCIDTTGHNTYCSNGYRYWTEIYIPYNVTLTGLAYLVGGVGGTDSVVVQLCNSSGVEVATSKLTGLHHGAIVGTAEQFQSCAFAVGATPTTYAAVAGKYFAVVQFNGAHAKFKTYDLTGSKFEAATYTGTWDVKANITPVGTFTAAKGPIVMTY